MTRFGLGFIQKPSGNGAFSPSDIPGLLWWFDASDTGTITEALGVVSQWDDKAGSNDVSQGTEANRPTTSTINGNASILFDGSNDVLFNNSVNLATPDSTFFLVMTSLSDSGTHYMCTHNNGGANALFFRHVGTQLRSQHNATGDNSIPQLTGKPVINDSFAAIARHESNGTSDIESDDGSSATDSVVGTLNTPMDEVFIGARTSTGTNSYDGHIHEIGLYDNKISDGDKTSLMDYLKAKWTL